MKKNLAERKNLFTFADEIATQDSKSREKIAAYLWFVIGEILRGLSFLRRASQSFNMHNQHK